jgi:hypothetical protein
MKCKFAAQLSRGGDQRCRIRRRTGSETFQLHNPGCRARRKTVNLFQYCIICRPSDSTMSEDAGIEPRTDATFALAITRLNIIHISSFLFVQCFVKSALLKHFKMWVLQIFPSSVRRRSFRYTDFFSSKLVCFSALQEKFTECLNFKRK